MNDKLSIPGHILKTNLSKSSSWNKNVNENIALKKKTGCGKNLSLLGTSLGVR